MSGNKLTELPDDMGDLPYLQFLHVNHNRLARLPTTIGRCSHLSELNLAYNKLKRLPDTFGDLTSVRFLHLNNNRLERLPSRIGNLVKLKEMNLSSNRLERLPSTLGLCSSLGFLNLRNNFLDETVPREVKGLPRLQKLDLTGNRTRASRAQSNSCSSPLSPRAKSYEARPLRDEGKGADPGLDERHNDDTSDLIESGEEGKRARRPDESTTFDLDDDESCSFQFSKEDDGIARPDGSRHKK